MLPKDWYFNKASDGDINTYIAEDKAIQEAVYTSIELDGIKEKVSSSIEEKTKEIQPLVSLNEQVLENSGNYYFSKSGTQEYELLQIEYNKVIESDYGVKIDELTKDILKVKNNLIH